MLVIRIDSEGAGNTNTPTEAVHSHAVS